MCGQLVLQLTKPPAQVSIIKQNSEISKKSYKKLKMVIKCEIHNLPEQVICVGQLCTKRIGCQLCVNKHDHKFYLDAKNQQKSLQSVQKEVGEKVTYLKKYTIANVNYLKLNEYKQKLVKQLEEEQFYLKSKLQQEALNFNLLIEKADEFINTCIENKKQQIKDNWKLYYTESQKYLDSIGEFDQLMEYFQKGNWTQHEHVEHSVNFLYSQELLFRFNRNLDNIKKVIKHHRAQNQKVLYWLEQRRQRFKDYQLCPYNTFKNWKQLYQNPPVISGYTLQMTKELRDDQKSVLSFVGEDKKAALIYPKSIYKLVRYDNQVFATTGGRSVNIWTRISMQPQKSFPLQYPSYALCTFNEKGQDQPEKMVFGQSNGQLGLLDMKKQSVRLMSAHQAAIRDVIQFDHYHFLTASQDWLLKLWGMNSPQKEQFASERLVLKGHSGKLHCLAKFGPSVLAGGADGTIRLWDVMRQSFDEVFSQQKQIHALAEIRPQLFASGGQLKEVRVWDYRKVKQPAIKFPIEHSCQTVLKYDLNTIIFNDKNVVKVIDIRNFKQPVLRLQNKGVYSYAINSMDFLSDVEIGMGGNDNFITLWKY